MENTEPLDNDPKFDSMSNSLALKFSGDPKNPKLCVRILRWTDNCISGACNSGVTYVSGYTIQEYCSTNGINYFCEISVIRGKNPGQQKTLNISEEGLYN